MALEAAGRRWTACSLTRQFAWYRVVQEFRRSCVDRHAKTFSLLHLLRASAHSDLTLPTADWLHRLIHRAVPTSSVLHLPHDRLLALPRMKWTVALFAALAWVQSSQALYFYLEAGQNRCFLEELPKDTIVVGHYKAEEWQDTTKSYIVNDQLGIQIVVSEVESGDKVVNTRGLPQGKFTFTSHEAGDHTICLRSNYTGGWFSTPQVRMHLDIAVGEAKVDEEGEREHVKDLAGKVKDLNHRLADIRREQQFQREREAEFRVLSETTNSRAVWWSVLQLIVLLATCIWQVRHLRHFFESKKLR